VPEPLHRWLWKSFLVAAIIPLLVIELSFLAIYWVSNELVHRHNVDAVRNLSYSFLDDIAVREAASMSNDLVAITRATELFARQSLRALESSYQPAVVEKARYVRSAGGTLYTSYDIGTAAGFCSSLTPVDSGRQQKLWKLSKLDPFMMDVKKSANNVSSIYINTFDTCNRIYPYIDIIRLFPEKIDVTNLQFYYLADLKHNPARKSVWTDAYLDPAGHGWMVSSIAPVWRGSRLEGVVGLDITLKDQIETLLALKLPWNAYALLVDRNGKIIAIPPRGEADFQLKELTDHRYLQAIVADTFKPEAFDIFARKDTKALGDAMRQNAAGNAMVEFHGKLHQASFATIAGPQWRLVIIAPTDEIRKEADALRQQLRNVSYLMAGGLFLFYILFFLLLDRRARVMSRRVALMARIGRGEYRQTFSGSEVRELHELGQQLADTGQQIADAHGRILRQDHDVTRALMRQRQLNEEQVRFVRVMSHELRTPLAVIDSGAQIVSMRAEQISAEYLRARMDKLRKAVQRISLLLHKLVEISTVDEAGQETEPVQVPLRALITDIAMSLVPAAQLQLTLPESSDENVVVADGMAVAFALRAALNNAMLYSCPGSAVGVMLKVDADKAVIEVSDCGPGIPEAEIEQVGQRYFRGSSANGKEGAGISLHLARKLIDRVGGGIAIRSRPGLTTVTIKIPVVARAG